MSDTKRAGDVRTWDANGEKACVECGRDVSKMRGLSWCPYCIQGHPPRPEPSYAARKIREQDGLNSRYRGADTEQ